MNLKEIKRSAAALSTTQLTKLEAWLHTLIGEREAAGLPNNGNQHRTLQERRDGHRTYRLQGVRCGKEKCKCASGELHGPYWYAYRSEGGRTKSQYVGKKLPAKKKR